VPDRAPWALGVNVTDIVQVPSVARVAGLSGQLWVTAKSARFVPMLLIVIAELCPFFSVNLWTELEVPWA
jgi:hypothetical protein